MASLSSNELENALSRLEEAMRLFNSEKDLKMKEVVRDSVIQRFEFCFELSWKVSIKLLGLTSTAPRPALREMAKASLIKDIQSWFDFLEARNKSSHTYDEIIAQEVLSVVIKFIPEARSLLQMLKTK